MHLIAQIKLLPTPHQAAALSQTLATANAACTAISAAAWQQQCFSKFPLQKDLYHPIKPTFGLSAQLLIRCIAKVCDSYATDRTTCHTFRPYGAIAFDDRILSFRLAQQTVSIWTTAGRQTIPFVCGSRQAASIQTRQGESDLVMRKGHFYLLVTCTVAEPPPAPVEAGLGVDLGIINLATDSDGGTHSGAGVERVRQRYQRRRDRLQRVGTKSAKRRLRKNSGRQRRFQTDTNHCIAKQLVQRAKDTGRGIALEDLTHIRQRTTVRQSVRAKHSNCTFRQLRTFIVYKAQLHGVPMVLVDPRYTSQRCNLCGTVDKRNRVNQATFRCVQCGHTTGADGNAACNIRDRANVSWPMASDLRVQVQAHPL